MRIIFFLLDLRQIFNVLAVVAEGDVLGRVSLFLALRQIRFVGLFIPKVQHDLLGDGRLELGAVRSSMIASTMITSFSLTTCVEIKILRRVRAESSRRPPRHRATLARWRGDAHTARDLGVERLDRLRELRSQFAHALFFGLERRDGRDLLSLL